MKHINISTAKCINNALSWKNKNYNWPPFRYELCFANKWAAEKTGDFQNLEAHIRNSGSVLA
jgi:hypothetical protein